MTATIIDTFDDIKQRVLAWPEDERWALMEALDESLPVKSIEGFEIDDELFAELERERIAHEKDPTQGMTIQQFKLWMATKWPNAS